MTWGVNEGKDLAERENREEIMVCVCVCVGERDGIESR